MYGESFWIAQIDSIKWQLEQFKDFPEFRETPMYETLINDLAKFEQGLKLTREELAA